MRAWVSLITVKELLGHSTVKVTERYTHSDRNSKNAAVGLMAKKSFPREDFVPTLSTQNEEILRNILFSVN
jgi:hypothetical protein